MRAIEISLVLVADIHQEKCLEKPYGNGRKVVNFQSYWKYNSVIFHLFSSGSRWEKTWFTSAWVSWNRNRQKKKGGGILPLEISLPKYQCMPGIGKHLWEVLLQHFGVIFCASVLFWYLRELWISLTEPNSVGRMKSSVGKHNSNDRKLGWVVFFPFPLLNGKEVHFKCILKAEFRKLQQWCKVFMT